MGHTAPHNYVSLPNHGKSFAMLSINPPSEVARAVVFIHGFNGDARSTWADFVSVIEQDDLLAWWQPADLFFLHYRWASVFHELVNNTATVFKFVRAVYPHPNGLLGASNEFRDASFRYRELFLVGHSEGGLLVRKAILLAAEQDQDLQDYLDKSRYEPATPPAAEGMLQAKVRLFAPALAGEMLSGIFGILATIPVVSNALMASPAKREMAPYSAPVTAAREQTDDYAAQLLFDCFRADIVWAEHDSIVSAEKYRRDRQCLSFPRGTDHISVCKPKRSYRMPVEFIEKGWNQRDCN
jgi:pimeloyl-ACP methyl ester carboxylesterase